MHMHVGRGLSPNTWEEDGGAVRCGLGGQAAVVTRQAFDAARPNGALQQQEIKPSLDLTRLD